MTIDTVTFCFALDTMTVFVHKGNRCFSIAEVEICDRDFDCEEEQEYMQSLAEEVAYDRVTASSRPHNSNSRCPLIGTAAFCGL